MTSAGAVPDLTAAADVLGRAADRLEKVAREAESGPWRVVEQHGRDIAGEGWSTVRVMAELGPIAECAIDESGASYCAQENAEFIAAVDPHAVAALAEPLREAAGDIERAIKHYGSEEAAYSYAAPDDVVCGLIEFARRVLCEEETP